MEERLHKVLAHCGVGSRRECEELIRQGRVEVDGRLVTELGTKVDPSAVELKVDGERVSVEAPVYYLVHKPKGYLCTSRDDYGRPRVIDLVPEHRRIYTAGRLDEDSEGLVLVTNDGDLTNVLTHPRYKIEKGYRLTVKGPITQEQVEKIESGVWLADGRTAPTDIRKVQRKGGKSLVTVTLHEGRSRELRRIFAKVGLRVSHLLCTSIGPLRIEDLKPGGWRRLQPKELAWLRKPAPPKKKGDGSGKGARKLSDRPSRKGRRGRARND